MSPFILSLAAVTTVTTTPAADSLRFTSCLELAACSSGRAWLTVCQSTVPLVVVLLFTPSLVSVRGLLGVCCVALLGGRSSSLSRFDARVVQLLPPQPPRLSASHSAAQWTATLSVPLFLFRPLSLRCKCCRPSGTALFALHCHWLAGSVRSAPLSVSESGGVSERG